MTFLAASIRTIHPQTFFEITTLFPPLRKSSVSKQAEDRAEKGPGAHIIETRDGKLIGSFTRLTKVRMAEFRKLLAEEKQLTVSKPETDIKSTRLLILQITRDFYEEYPIPKASDAQTVPRKRPIIKHAKMPKWQRELWLKQMADIDIPPTEQFRPTSPVRVISAQKARFQKEIKKTIWTRRPRKQARKLWIERKL
ncbi:hypothetical protein [Acetobacter oryzoeni]|uniref:Uncharacterized protein n=1 Tax=Acetobacter oryzoeni TaxID=2500548 RepID=A0A5B9GRE8_9PROT|nr:hypothetical protein [Acetobacter oryzoeni]MCP1203680.1 hypothetical protein [Acetobacter oryzoeni]QEE86930.1 hypothetical protein EOV40_014610 [Acetobacter oryzoeni]